jgi:hypothetical protein
MDSGATATTPIYPIEHRTTSDGGLACWRLYADRMEVRRANPGDAAAIAGVHVRSWEAAYRGLVPEAWFAERTLQRRGTMWRQLLRRDEHTAASTSRWALS